MERNLYGLTENNFKTCYNNHPTPFRHQSKQSSSELSKYIWSLNTAGPLRANSWKMLRSVHRLSIYLVYTKYMDAPDHAQSGQWHVICVDLRSFYIIFRSELSLLSSRSEVVSTCRHSRQFTLGLFKKHTTALFCVIIPDTDFRYFRYFRYFLHLSVYAILSDQFSWWMKHLVIKWPYFKVPVVSKFLVYIALILLYYYLLPDFIVEHPYISLSTEPPQIS